ncbi:hypothetical protein AAC387_Pa09g0510 [Persea americana]
MVWQASQASQDPFKKTPNRLSDPLVGDEGRIYTCSERIVYSFESSGTVAWAIPLNYTCNVNIAPICDGRGKIYIVADNTVLKINPSNIGTSTSAIETIIGEGSSSGGSDEIIGISISIWSSSLFITIKNHGLFAYTLSGQLLWSVGPVLYRSGYRQGCKKNITDCYFTSAPVIDQCEGSVYIANTEGQLYSLSIQNPYFKWIQDFSALDKHFMVTPGNNGRLLVTFPRRAVVIALGVSSGNILWQKNVGPLSKGCPPVFDSNGWVSIGSLDGFLYSFSPSGVLKKYLTGTASYSVVQVSPVLDYSGYAVYVAQTRMEAKTSHTIGEYTSISAMKPTEIFFTMLTPAAGTVYWTAKYPGQSLLFLQSDIRHFPVDERILLAFIVSAKMAKALPFHTTRQKLAWSCSQANPKYLSIYTGNEKTILLFLLFQFIVLIVLAGFVNFCYIFWRKRKLQHQDLGKFLEKRHSLHIKKNELSRSISELEQKSADEGVANEVLDRMAYMVREREKVERKLSTTYSLGRDEPLSKSQSLLPLYNGKGKSYSFQGSKKESVTIFHTLTDASSQESSSSSSSNNSSSPRELSWHSCGDKESAVKAKASIEEVGSSSSRIVVCQGGGLLENLESPASRSKGYTNPLYIEHPPVDNELREMQMDVKEEELAVDPMKQGTHKGVSLKRRTLSSNYNSKQLYVDTDGM